MEDTQEQDKEDKLFLCICLFTSQALTSERHLFLSRAVPRTLSNQAAVPSDCSLIVSSPLCERIARLPVVVD